MNNSYFDKYVSNYDMNDPDINYKYYHSYRVMNNMELLARCMNIPVKDVELAKYIGLLHDIGRFEQDKLYNSFLDKEMDHGDYGVEVLIKENILSHFDIDTKDYEVVYKAIKNHNKYQIEDNLTPRELYFSKLIRDADKLDILYALSNEELKPIIYEDDTDINIDIKESFFNNKQIKRTNKETRNDNIVVVFSFLFDINYEITLDIIKSNKYCDKFYQRLKNKDLFKQYIDYINKYINERID